MATPGFRSHCAPTEATRGQPATWHRGVIVEAADTLAPRLCAGHTPDTGDRQSDGGSEHDAGLPATRTGAVWQGDANAASLARHVDATLMRMREQLMQLIDDLLCWPAASDFDLDIKQRSTHIFISKPLFRPFRHDFQSNTINKFVL